jgi:hypothetical protein
MMAGSLVRRACFGLMALFAFGALSNAATEMKAAEVRFFVPQSSGLFEVKGSTGGRFITAPTSEFIQVPGRGPVRVVGYTDRAQRGETVVTQVRGSGSATICVTRTFGGRTSNLVGPIQVTLPIVVGTLVSPNANDDNITVCVTQNGAMTCRRLPVGTRP